MNSIEYKIKKDIVYIPEYLNCLIFEHKQLWKLIQNIYTEISKICLSKKSDVSKVINIADNIRMLMNNIFEISDDSDMGIVIFSDIESNIDSYLEIALDCEEYEICSNLKKLKTLL